MVHKTGDVMRKKLVIAVDYDGTIVKNAFPNTGKFKFLAKAVILWIKRRNHILVLNTCRVDNYDKGKMFLTAAVCKTASAGIEFDYINKNVPKRIARYGSDCRKISADWYIDDKAGFLGWWSIPFIIWWLERR